MKRAEMVALLAGAGSALFALGNADAAVTYNVNPSADPTGNRSLEQQAAYDRGYLGDDVHLAAAEKIETLQIRFGYFTFDGTPTYTPDLTVDLFDIDSNGIPIDSNTADALAYTPIASVHRNDATFTGSNYNNGGNVRDVSQVLSFDFTSQNIIRQNLAFAYHDDNPAGMANPDTGDRLLFSVLLGNPVSIGSSNDGILVQFFNGPGQNYPVQQVGTFAYFDQPLNIEASLNTSPVPEPTLLLLASSFGMLSLRRTRQCV